MIPSKTKRNGLYLPEIELRRRICNKEWVKLIIMCAMTDQPITILPTFRNKLKSLNTLVNNGVLGIDSEKNEYYFLIE